MDRPASPELTLWANPSVTGQFAEFGDLVREARHGDVLSAAGFDVHVYGHDHALIHKDIPSVANTGFLIDRALFHPGDSFTVPDVAASTSVARCPLSTPSTRMTSLSELSVRRATISR